MVIVLGVAVAIGFVVVHHPTSTSAHGPTASPHKRTITPIVRTQDPRPAMGPPGSEQLQRLGGRGPGAADGVLPGAVSVDSDTYAGITHLNPQMLASLRRAADEARRYGIAIDIDSGWRSRAYQQQLFDQAIATYGSEAAAARWVARPGTSIHEAGDAVDVAGRTAEAWLWRNGASYGLCRMYGNEPWHFEWRPQARLDGCPQMYADPTRDPRLSK